MPIISTRDDARVLVDQAGVGRNLVLISGLGGTASFWQPLVDALGTSIRTTRFDQRGIGGSERGTVDVTVRALAEDTWEIIDKLAIDEPVLWGHSTGGAIVQEMALMRPDRSPALVLSGAWVGPDAFVERLFRHRLDLLTHDPKRYAELAAMLAWPPRWLNDHPEILRNTAHQAPREADIQIVAERIAALLAHDCRATIYDITTPTLVLGAEDDMIVPPYLQEELASLLPGAQLHIFETGGHFFPVTRAADTAAQFHRWLERRQR